MSSYRQDAFQELLTEFGSRTKIAKKFGLSSAAITKWSKEGIPKARIPYFVLAYPHWKAWKDLPRGV